MTTTEAIKLAARTLNTLAWDCDLTNQDEAERLWEAVELLVDIVDGRRGFRGEWIEGSAQSGLTQ